MTNLKMYDQVRKVPKEALTTIVGGRLKGKSSINPMWRIKALTEQFGMAGIGWYTEITRQELVEGANGEKSAFVDINLYVKVDGEWSKPIFGTGGSSFVAKEKNGLYVSDECYKMAYTDALSVACKALGIGADIYWENDRDKYAGQSGTQAQTQNAQQKQQQAQQQDINATKRGQLLNEILKIAEKKKLSPELLTGLIQHDFKKESSTQLTMQELYALKRRLEA